jgi:hypothetical protein
MRLAWRSLIPVSLALLLMSGLVVYMRWHPIWMLAGNVLIFVITMVVGPLIPAGPPVNRRVGLPGSRFSPPKPVEA